MSERITISGGIVVTLDEDDTVLLDGTVVIDADRIAYVGPASDAPQPRGRVIDASGKAVMPGLVDLHYHTAIGRGWSDHLPLWESLEYFWYPAIRALDDEAAYWAALASYAESLKCGVTTVNDMYRRLEGLAAAAEEIGIRAVLSNDIADPEHGLDTLEDAQAAHASRHGSANGRIEVAVGIEWLPLASEGLLRDARALADDLGILFHIHLNESMTEVDNSLERFGRRPTEVAYDCGVLGPDCIAAHCVWLSDHEISLMAETGTHISHNPGSNAKLANGIARLPEMLAAGINVGIGHDAAECNNTRDIFQAMRLASVIHRAVRQDATLGQPGDIVKMATVNSGRALGHQTGRLHAGWKADVILIDLSGPMFVPLLPEYPRQLMSHLVFSAAGSCVDTTIVDGKVVMEGRTLTTIDEQRVYAEANRAFRAVLDRMVVPEQATAGAP